jgi:hypothetical protein
MVPQELREPEAAGPDLCRVEDRAKRPADCIRDAVEDLRDAVVGRQFNEQMRPRVIVALMTVMLMK